MSLFELRESIERAQRRLGGDARRRVGRRGVGSKLVPELLAEVQQALRSQERRPISSVLKDVEVFARARDLRPPSRTTIYRLMATTPSATYSIGALPTGVRAALYNLPEAGDVPGHQLAFYCFNYGGAEAATFASTLPWLALYQAARMPGWRRRSHDLLLAALRSRCI